MPFTRSLPLDTAPELLIYIHLPLHYTFGKGNDTYSMQVEFACLCAASRSRRACLEPLALAARLDSSIAVCSACAYRRAVNGTQVGRVLIRGV